VRVYLVRHAEAAPGSPDEERQLTPAGREQAARLGDRLAQAGERPDAVVTSPLLRARQTGDLIAAPLGLEPESDERLGFGATAERLAAAVSGRGEAVVVVAHEPDCGEIHAALTGGDVEPFAPGEARPVDVPD
jgi:phosphohistidine phosphatase